MVDRDSRGETSQHFSRKMWEGAKRYFISGIATVFPLFITLYVIVVLVRFMYHIAGTPLNRYLESTFGYAIPGIGIIVLVAVIFIIGVFSRLIIGRRLLPWLERILHKIPLIASIYPSAKQLSDFLFSGEREEFKKVVLVEYPYQGSYSLGFVTNESLDSLNSQIDKELINVFIPLAPAPFSGILLLLPSEKVKVLDIPVDQAVKYFVSGGVVFKPPLSE